MERAEFDPAEKQLIDDSVTRILEVVPELAEAMARSLQEQIPELGGPEDRVASAIARRSSEAVVRELCAMLRDGSSRSARENPAAIAEYASLMRRRGADPDAVRRAYDRVLEMFQHMLMTEMRRMDRSDERADNALGSVGRLLSDWFERTATHITTSSLQATAKRTASGGHMQAEQLLDKMWDALTRASHDKHISERLALADIKVRIDVADEPDLGITLMLDRDPIALEQDAPGDVEITIPVAELEQLWSEEYNLALAIAQGRVEAHGPVRRFLRVVPIVSTALREAEGTGDRRPSHLIAEEEAAAERAGMHVVPPSFDDADRDLLDHAAEYSFHEGAMEVAEEHPGSYWSIQFIDTYKRFGANKVLAGLNLGIPEGMITVILGPSGVGKSVTIKHIVGLLFPDAGDVIVHGRSVLDRTRSELFEMRRGFGMLFQDGALFGSMNLYDNVAFPLREHTTKRESEIREIVMGRLEEVGLADAIDRMPNELSGGMRKRAGFARALVLEPEVVIFDEPDSGLDPVRTALLVELIRDLHSQHGGTYIVVTHDIESARTLGGYIAVLWRGRIVQAGEHQRMFNSENPFVRQFLNRETAGPLGMR